MCVYVRVSVFRIWGRNLCPLMWTCTYDASSDTYTVSLVVFNLFDTYLISGVVKHLPPTPFKSTCFLLLSIERAEKYALDRLDSKSTGHEIPGSGSSLSPSPTHTHLASFSDP